MKTFFALLFITIFSVSGAQVPALHRSAEACPRQTSDQGMTTEILRSAQKAYCIGEELATQQPDAICPTL